jgi:PAS domain S-box-containing protein
MKLNFGLPDPTLPEHVFRSVVETAADAILLVDGSGRIVIVNGQAERLFGYPRDELIGQEIEILIPARLRTNHRLDRTAYAATPQPRPMGARLDLSALRKDGSELPVEIGLAPMTIGEEKFVSAVIRDVSDRRSLEAELQANRMRMIASARLSAIGTMASEVAHEINNPLAVIHAVASDLAESAERGETSPRDVVDDARRIRQYAERISKIVSSLRRLAREGEHDPLRETPVVEIVAYALDLCKQLFRQHSVELAVTPVDPRMTVVCREVQIAQIVVNLLQNAFDAALEQPDPRWVRLAVDTREDRLVVSVTDSGRGLPAEIKTRIMEPFFTTKPVGKGTGLGLSLAKQIAEEHGGTIEVGERDGHTCFSLCLPASRPPEEA